MKSHQVLFLLATLLFSIGSCTKELSKESPVQNPGAGNFHATIDGQPWGADSLQQASVENGVLTITGISKTQDAVSIVLPALQTGVYAVNGQSPGFALFTNIQDTVGNIYLSNASADASLAGGTVSLISIDTVNKTISGTFQFKLYQESNSTTKTVSDGVFTDIPYIGGGSTVTPPPPEDSTSTDANTDTVLASIDGADWNASVISASAQSGSILIMGASDDSAKISLIMPQAIAAGTYTLDVNGALYVGAYNPDALHYFISQGNGTLTIFKNDVLNRRITGNFDFAAQSLSDPSSVQISSGYFSVNY